MGELWDKIRAKGYGAADIATGGTVDDVYPKILEALPFDDKTGIPREYASGSAANDYQKEYKADREDLARRYPRNFADGGALMGAAQAVPTMTLGPATAVGAGVGLGALQGYGNSERGGIDRIKDAVRGGAVGGGLASASNLATAAAPALKTAWEGFNRPPPGPAMAGAGTSVPTKSFVSAAVPAPSINRAGMLPPRGPNPGRYDIQDIQMPSSPRAQADAAFGSAPTEMAPRAVPDLATAEGEANHALQKIKARPNSIPLEATSTLPKPAKIPQFDEADIVASEKNLRNKESTWQAEHNKAYAGKKIDPEEEYAKWREMKAKRAAEQDMRAAGTVRPPKAKKALPR